MQPLNNVQKPDFVSVRDAFRHEAQDFTKWLEENIDSLSSRIGIELTVLEREKSVGSFNVDLFCETNNGRYAIVENQLEKNDHDHLGKLLTYLVNLEATTAIWVTPDARPEHQRVIDWLNESTSADYAFYLVQVEAIRIGNSPYAPLFTILAAPDDQTREIGETKKELADNRYQYQEFWTQLLEKSKMRTNLFLGNSPQKGGWLYIKLGKIGVQLGIWTSTGPKGSWVDLLINVGDKEKNKLLFDQLFAQKDAIQIELDEPIEWLRNEKRPPCRIVRRITGGLTTPDKWSAMQDELITIMIKFDKVFRPRIDALQV